jgi:hypothetical protein
MARLFTGSTGKVIVGSTTLNVKSWEATPTCDLQENTHSGSSGYKTFNAGNMGMTGTVTMEWDAESNPTDNPPNLNVGESVALKLYLEDTEGFYIEVAAALIRETPIAVTNGSNVTFTAKWTASGTWTMPSGSF